MAKSVIRISWNRTALLPYKGPANESNRHETLRATSRAGTPRLRSAASKSVSFDWRSIFRRASGHNGGRVHVLTISPFGLKNAQRPEGKWIGKAIREPTAGPEPRVKEGILYDPAKEDYCRS